MKRTWIVVTLMWAAGLSATASETNDLARALGLEKVENGVCRLSMSPGTLGESKAVIAELRALLAEQQRLTTVVAELRSKSPEIRRELNAIYGHTPRPEEIVAQSALLRKFAAPRGRVLAEPSALHVLIVEEKKAAAYLAKGNRLLTIEDRIGMNSAGPIEQLVIVVPKDERALIALQQSGRERLKTATEAGLFTAVLGLSRLTLVNQLLPPRQIHTRWFVSGLSRAVAMRVLREFFPMIGFSTVLGTEAQVATYVDIKKDVMLLNWLESEHTVVPDFEAEIRLAMAREHFAMREMEAVIKEKGLDSVKAITAVAARRRRFSREDALGCIQHATGIDFAARLTEYRAYTEVDAGIERYREQLRQAAVTKDAEAILYSELRLVEVVLGAGRDPTSEYPPIAKVLGSAGFVAEGLDLLKKQMRKAEFAGDTARFRLFQREVIVYGLRHLVPEHVVDVATAMLLQNEDNGWALAVEAYRLKSEGWAKSASYLARAYRTQLESFAAVDIEVVFPVLDMIDGGKKKNPPNTGDGLKTLVAGAEAGAVHCQFLLGNRYLAGLKGVEKDEKLAVSWLRKAAEAGYPPAQSMLATCYTSGLGVEKDHDEVLHWLQAAAKQRDAKAAYRLALLYLAGPLGQQDLRAAVTHMALAVRGGEPAAMVDLALMYNEARGVPLDPARTISLLKRAAARDHAEAKFALWEAYRQRRGASFGVKEYEAKKWLKGAAAQGHPDALAELKRLKAMAAGAQP